MQHLRATKAVEDYKHQLSLKMELEKFRAFAANESRNVALKGVLEFAQMALRTTILANGFAATAILSSMKSSSPEDHRVNFMTLGIAAGVAGFGVALGFFATVMAYLNQWIFWKSQIETNGSATPGQRWERSAALISVILSMFTFLLTVFLTAISFQKPQ